jgi:hypothetical protein
MTAPTPPPAPPTSVALYTPWAATSPLRYAYRSLVEVLRLDYKLDAGAPTYTWARIPDVIDPYIDVPGQMMCRLDIGFMRPGKGQPMPVVAGRAPDRIGLLFCDVAAAPSGQSLIKSGDRIHTLAGPVFGTFEIRVIPDVAQDYVGAHHLEIQVIEVAQSLAESSVTPFPGSEGNVQP